jgi:ferredoxin-type protein NapG
MGSFFSRRQFVRSVIAGGAVVGTALAGYFPVIARWRDRLRPPGAKNEQEFLAACIKCGQCVQVCPVEAIKLAGIDDGFGVGVPYIETRDQACDFSCDALQCILACPTGALDPHHTTKKEEVRMGMARFIGHDRCLAGKGKGFKGLARGPHFKGLLRYEEIDRWDPKRISSYEYDVEQCDLCVRECPIEGAITIERSGGKGHGRPLPVIHDACVGCGTCDMICPAEPSCFEIEPYVETREV